MSNASELDISNSKNATPTYWLHRISWEGDVAYALMRNGYLSIGWSFVEADILNAYDNASNFDQIMKANGVTTRSRWCLWNFSRFKPGDYVVVPLSYGKFSIFRITSNPMHISQIDDIRSLKLNNGEVIERNTKGLFVRSDGNEVDLGFAIKVEPIRSELLRYEYADSALTARMKIRPTNADISDLHISICNAINSTAPIDPYALISENLSEQLLEIIRKTLNPVKFELLIEWYFRKIGAKTFIPPKNSSQKRDWEDADIVATFDSLRVVFLIQAKFHTGKTDDWAVTQISKYEEQYKEAMGDYSVISWVITSAAFTESAVISAQSNNVRLVDGTEFARLLIDVGVNDINSAFN